MLRVTQNTSASGATNYFFGYYAEEDLEPSIWGGKGAEMLGLSGEIQEEDFSKIAHNINPLTDEQLTARNSEKRTVAYDFTFSVPKSVSLVYALTEDKEILQAFNNALSKTMEQVESVAETRVRTKGRNENRETGNLIWAEFMHGQSRPVDGMPDPQLHKHVFVINSTYDEKSQSWKAAQFRNLKAKAPLFESIFNSEMALGLQEIGYATKRTKTSFEIDKFEPSLLDKYSNRKKEIEALAEELKIKSATAKDKLGATTRKGKIKDIDQEEVLKTWEARATEEELFLIRNSKNSGGDPPDEKKEISAKESLDYALEISLERKSTVHESELMREALKRSCCSVSFSELKKEMEQKETLISKFDKNRNEKLFTTEGTLAEEKKLRDTAREGKNILEPVNPNYQTKNEILNSEQVAATNHALNSKDFITIISGGAGTGKTSTIKEVAAGAKEAGVPFHAFAPTSKAKDVQKEEGFQTADTVARLLIDEKLQGSLKNSVIWLDEAGLIGNKTMNKVLDIAKEQNARILLTGDIKQHNAVERGDSLRVIQKYGGIEPARISKIQRQKIHGNQSEFSENEKARVDNYRSAVKSISEGDIEGGYKKLDKMGAMNELEGAEEVAAAVAQNYVSANERKKNVLVFTPTHSQGKLVTEAIRNELKEKGLLGKTDKQITIARNLGLKAEEKKDLVNYAEGQQLQFHKPAKGGITRGSKFDVVKATKEGVLVKSGENLTRIIPFSETDRFSVYQKETISLAKGEQIRVTKNSTSKDGKRLNNGTLLKIEGFTPEGSIKASTGKRKLLLDKDHANLAHGYYSTSVGGQGVSVDEVLIMQTSLSGKAANKEQFYVSASRGKFNISIFTDNKERLLQSVQKTSQRMTAIELATPEKKGMNATIALKEQFKKFGLIYKSAQSKVASFSRNFAQNSMLRLSPTPKKSVINAPTIRK